MQAIAKSFATTIESSVNATIEAYDLLHNRFVIPAERVLVTGWQVLTCPRALACYKAVWAAFVVLCVVVYQAGADSRPWVDALIEECESEEELQFVPVACANATIAAKRWVSEFIEIVWDLDAMYQLFVVDRVKSEIRVVVGFEWIVDILTGLKPR